MKVEAMVFRFSKPSSSALTSPSAGDTAQGSVPTQQQSPQATRVPSPRALAVLPPRRAGWGGAAECADCDVGVGLLGLRLGLSQARAVSPTAGQRQAGPRLSRGTLYLSQQPWGAESMTAAQR